MGIIADLTKGAGVVRGPAPQELRRGILTPTLSPNDASRALWRQTFGVSKEEPRPGEGLQRPIVPGGDWGRGISSSGEMFKRFLRSMRSFAPGSWTDDRIEQGFRHYRGIAYVAIRACAQQLSRAEFQVYKRDPYHPDGKRPLMRGEQGYGLVELLENPNREDSFGDLMYDWSMQMDLTGEALTWMSPNIVGNPYELYVIPTALAIPGPVMTHDYPQGYYQVQPYYPNGPYGTFPGGYSSVGVRIPGEWMMRFKYNHPFVRYEGYSPLTALQLHLDEVESMDRSRWYSMKRSINPSAVLNMDQMEGSEPFPEDQIDRIRAEWEAQFQGPENHGSLIIAAPGSRLDPFGTSPKEMDYQAGWEQLTAFTLAGFGVTKEAAGMIGGSSYSTLFATLKQLYWMTLEPRCEKISAKINKLLAPFFADDIFVEIRCKPIDDHDVKNQKLSLAMSAKCITKNEMRQELGFGLTLEPWGSEMAGTEPLMSLDPMLGEIDQTFPQAAPEGMFPGVLTDILIPDSPLMSPDDDGKGEHRPSSNARPGPDKLGRRALGPRMGTGPYPGKSLRRQLEEVATNGSE